MHDLSKLNFYEWKVCAETLFCSSDFSLEKNGLEDYPDEKIQEKLDYIYNKHIHKSPHHWQYWVLKKGNGFVIQRFQNLKSFGMEK